VEKQALARSLIAEFSGHVARTKNLLVQAAPASIPPWVILLILVLAREYIYANVVCSLVLLGALFYAHQVGWLRAMDEEILWGMERLKSLPMAVLLTRQQG
jgi:hypothetical protein